MRRRTLLRLGLASTAVLAAGAASLAWRDDPLHPDGLGRDAIAVFGALAPAVLADLLPGTARARADTLKAHIERVGATIAGLSPASRAELRQLLRLLAHPLGRVPLTA